MDDEERKGLGRMASESARVFYIKTRSFVRHALALHTKARPLDFAFAKMDGGKPRVKSGPPVEFSLSHSGGWIAVGVGDRPLGLDIEARMPHVDPLALASRFFHFEDAKQLALFSEVKPEFRRQWVAKEASLKAAGRGIADGLSQLRCIYCEGEIRSVSAPFGTFLVSNFLLPGATPGAVASESPFEMELIEI